MSEEFKDITNWAAIVGIWDFSNASPVYRSPDGAQPDGSRDVGQPQFPYGLCVSNVRFSEGTARATIRCSRTDNSNDVEVDGRLLFGYRSLANEYFTIGLGGHGFAYTVYHYDPSIGWRCI